jgi:hypothetical protein
MAFLISSFAPFVVTSGAIKLVAKPKSKDLSTQRQIVKDFLITSTKKLHFADFLTKHTLDFVLHRLLGGLTEMDTDDIGGLSDFSSDCRAVIGFWRICGISHSKSSCK